MFSTLYLPMARALADALRSARRGGPQVQRDGNDVVVGMVQQVDAGNAMTGRPYPVTDIRGVSRSVTYGAPVDPAR